MSKILYYDAANAGRFDCIIAPSRGVFSKNEPKCCSITVIFDCVLISTTLSNSGIIVASNQQIVAVRRIALLFGV